MHGLSIYEKNGMSPCSVFHNLILLYKRFRYLINFLLIIAHDIPGIVNNYFLSKVVTHLGDLTAQTCTH